MAKWLRKYEKENKINQSFVVSVSGCQEKNIEYIHYFNEFILKPFGERQINECLLKYFSKLNFEKIEI
jgi:hypothetical protein